MTELKCPFCGQELDWMPEDVYGSRCCENCKRLYGSNELWQALIDTKKKLDMANAELDYIQEQVAKNKVFETEDLQKKLDIAVKRLEDTVLDAEVLATPEYLASRAKETLEQINNLPS